MDTKNAHKKPSSRVKNDLKEQTAKQILSRLFGAFKIALTEREMEILQAFLVEDKTIKEIAEKMNLPTTRVKQMFNGAVTHLNARLDTFMQRYETAVRSEKEVVRLKEKLQSYETKENNILSLSAKAKEILPMEINNGIYKVADLVKLHKRNLLIFRNSGKVAVKEVDDFFAKHGLSWGMDV